MHLFFQGLFVETSKATTNMKSYEVDEKPWGSLKKKLNKDHVQETAMAVTPLRYRKLLDGLSSVSAGTSRKTSDSTDSGTRELAGIDNPALVEDEVCGNKTFHETHFDGGNDEEINSLGSENEHEITKGPLRDLVMAEDRALDFNNSKESTMI